MAEEDDRRELARIKARQAVLLDRFLFSLACYFVALLATIFAKHLGYEKIALLLFLASFLLWPISFYWLVKQKRLRWRYYNLHYRVQIEEESSGEKGLPNISLKRTNQSLRD